MTKTHAAIAKSLREKIAACVPDFGPHIDQTVSQFEAKQSAHMVAMQHARYLSQTLVNVNRVAFLNACGVKP